MSNTVLLRNTLSRAFGSNADINFASKCTIRRRSLRQHEQQHSYSTLTKTLSKPISISVNNKSMKQNSSGQFRSIDWSHISLHPCTHRLHTNSEYFDSVNVTTSIRPEPVTGDIDRTTLKQVEDKVPVEKSMAEIVTKIRNLNTNPSSTSTTEPFRVADSDSITSNVQITKLYKSNDIKTISEHKVKKLTNEIHNNKDKDVVDRSMENIDVKGKRVKLSLSTPVPSYMLWPAAGSIRDTSARVNPILFNK